MSIKVNWVNPVFGIPIRYHLAKNDENMNILYKDMPMLSTSQFGPIWPHSVLACSDGRVVF